MQWIIRILLLLFFTAGAAFLPWSALVGLLIGIAATTPRAVELLLAGVALDAFTASTAGFFSASAAFVFFAGGALGRIFEQQNTLTVALSAFAITAAYIGVFFLAVPAFTDYTPARAFFGVPFARMLIAACLGALAWRAATARLGMFTGV